jgi:SOS-response transcriptional repressor LexA
MLKLTARQEQILNLIKDAIQNTGFPPTRAEIAAELVSLHQCSGRAPAGTRKKGVIEIAPGTSRGIRLLESELSKSHHRSTTGVIAICFFTDKPATNRAGCGRIANTRIRTH